MMKRLFVIFLLAGIVYPAVARAAVYRLTPQDDWFAVLHGDHLKPGDEVLLGPGEYRDRRRLVVGHRGTKQRPIVIRATQNGKATLHRPDDRQNTINIEGAQHLVLRGIEITGGSTGIRLKKTDRHACKFVTIQDMHIHHVGGAAITANNKGNTYEGMIFRRNHIHHTSGHGEGFYLGTNN
ncbi:MAG: right-handed parallel beta-helix repeat-containing protein, partial [Planctomycetia bacterium]